jgi:hypothetical protein
MIQVGKERIGSKCDAERNSCHFVNTSFFEKIKKLCAHRWLIAVIALASFTHFAVCATLNGVDSQLRSKDKQSGSLGKPWSQIVGKKVVIEGIAWEGGKEDIGGVVLLDSARMYIDNGKFSENNAIGKLVRVVGILAVHHIAKAPPDDQGYPEDTDMYYIKNPKWEIINSVKWPWLQEYSDTPGKS